MKKLFWFNITATLFLFLFNLTFNYEEAVASGTIRIGLESRYLNANQVLVGGPVIINGTRFNGDVVIRVGSASPTHVYLVYNNSTFSYSHTPFIATAVDSNGIYIRGRRYRGYIELGRQVAGNGITPVNVVSMDYYLKSVVPSEMPSSWHMEALKAQAVAARTYAMNVRGSHNHLGYELCDTVFSQVYSGMEQETNRTNEAVLSTSGRIITYGGLPILAVYSSSHGGFSESSEYVWLESSSYLRALADPYETGGLVWYRTFTREQIQQALPASANIGEVIGITLFDRTPGSRVHTLIINGSTGNHSVEREQVRTFFSPLGGSLPSRMFRLGSYMPNPSEGSDTGASLGTFTDYYAIDFRGSLLRIPSNFYALGSNGIHLVSSEFLEDGNNNLVVPHNSDLIPQRQTHYFSDGAITFFGRGFGHGVGMSQFGAYSRARAGYTYVQILEFYFSGARVVSF